MRSDADNDYQAFWAKRFLSADDGSGEEVVGDEAGDGNGGDVHETVVGHLCIGLLFHLETSVGKDIFVYQDIILKRPQALDSWYGT